MPAETYDKIYTNGPDVIQAGSLIPVATRCQRRAAIASRANGRFASGCNHADYIDFAAFVEPPPNGGPSNDTPRIRFGVVPADDVEILDTWHVSGSKGRHDFQVSDLFVPQESTGSFLAPAPVVRHPLDEVHKLGRLGLELAAVAAGTAQGSAIDDLIEIGRTKKPLGGLMRRLAEDPGVSASVGRARPGAPALHGSCSTALLGPTTSG